MPFPPPETLFPHSLSSSPPSGFGSPHHLGEVSQTLYLNGSPHPTPRRLPSPLLCLSFLGGTYHHLAYQVLPDKGGAPRIRVKQLNAVLSLRTQKNIPRIFLREASSRHRAE